MNEEQDSVTIMEHELQEQERGLFQMEEELFERECGFLEHEQMLQQRYSALNAFADYVREEEGALERRAGNIGVVALENVRAVLAGQAAPVVPSLVAGVDADARRSMLERRRDLYALRLEILEAREQLLGMRHETIDNLLGAAGDVESGLLERQRLVGEAARQVFMGGAGDAPRGARQATTPVAVPRSPVARSPSSPGASTVPPQAAGFSPGAAADDAQRQQKPRSRLTQVKMTIEAQLDTQTGSTFFVDEQHLDGDLPGFFISTPNLLKVGKEVRVRLMRGGAKIEVGGRVEWVRERGKGAGQPGMGLQFFDVGDSERSLIATWSREMPPVAATRLNSN